MDVDDLVLEAPTKLGERIFMKRASTTRSASALASRLNAALFRPRPVTPGNMEEGEVEFAGHGFKVAPVGDHQDGIAFRRPERRAARSARAQCGSRVTNRATRWRFFGSVKRRGVSMPNSRPRPARPAVTAVLSQAREVQVACSVMLNWPRVTCSSRASMLACCSKRKLVMRATTPVLVLADDRQRGKLFHGGNPNWLCGPRQQRRIRPGRTGCRTKFFTSLVGQSCCSAQNSWAARQRRPTGETNRRVCPGGRVGAGSAASRGWRILQSAAPPRSTCTRPPS